MKLSRQFTVFGIAIFCVVVFSLYLMLDHIDHSKNPNGERIQNGQLGILQDKIDHLERLLAENNEIIANIRDSVINLRETVKDGKMFPEGNMSQGNVELLPPAPALLPIHSEDCQFAAQTYSKAADGVQMLDVYDLLSFDNPDGGVWKQGFDISYQDNEWDNEPLQVFVVPHSHNDPGWLKTFDDYYRDQTQHILNNMVVKLHEDSRRKMIWSEISYFSKWWDSIDEQKRDAVRRLIESGQLEVATGGWVMPDEASSHYFALIDQLVEGHQWLEINLGVKPKTGWAVDPFGHTPTHAYLLRQAGLSNMLIQRVHYSVKKHFASQKTLEFFWRQNWDQDSSSDILCHMMPFYSYDVPHTCGPDPKICCQFDFKRLPGGRISCPWRIPPQAITDNNIQERVQTLLDQYRKKSKLFRTNVLLAPLGDDFRYAEAVEWDQQFENYQKLFDYMNSHPELHVQAQFGTISDYFEALRKSTGMDPVGMNVGQLALPVLSGDFFTYADRDDHYWSGYFTSRPFYKRLDRVLESHLRAAEVLYSLTLANIQKYGQPSDYPAVDNYKLLTEARRNLGLFQHHDAITGTGKDWVVVDYGTRLFHSILNVKRVIVSSAHWLVLKDKPAYYHDPSNPFLQMVKAAESVAKKCFIKMLNFFAVPRLLVVYNPTEQARTSMVTVYVTTPKVRVLNALGHVVRAQVSAVWNDASHANISCLQKMRLKEDDAEFLVKVEFVWYGTTSNKDKSGAYLFLPDKEATIYSPSQPPVVRVTKGLLFSEVTTTFTQITHTLRLYNIHGVEGQSVELCNTVDIRGEINHEIAMRITSDLNSKDRFFTDLNGYQVQPRKTMAKLPLQANFYPMTSMVYLQDSSARLSLLTAQSLGAASLKSGQLEVIMDRRLNQDDNRGLGQGVLDNKITANSFRLLLEKRMSGFLEFWKFPAETHLRHKKVTYAHQGCIHLIKKNTLKTEGGGPSEQAALILHRKGFDCGFSNRNTGLLCSTTRGKIRLEKLLTDLKVKSITPVSLSLMHTHNSDADPQEISLKPMEIRTYRLQLS
uniref:mannosyl-oligosaccharide 1,3-1,6-alpha-mannosidase n=1 Tax=Sinocyclocheilus anshuiensis TaxID=1608454 RepID=A0A671SC83_9TELE